MRSVNKSWNALLSQSSFVKSHLNHSIRKKDQILLVFYSQPYVFSPTYFDSSSIKICAALPCRSPHLELTNFIKVPQHGNPEYGYTRFQFIGSVNGLICSSYDDAVIQIWNPCLSTVSTLPSYSPPPDPSSSAEYFRFGYDPTTDDYKVVKLTGLAMPPDHAFEWCGEVEIYSMRKGAWEFITERFPSHITSISRSDHLCADGREGYLHWFCCVGENMDLETIIVAFDLGSETFREIPLPDLIIDDNRENFLGVLTGKLCVTSCSRLQNGSCEVWVMEEYGVSESWVKRHVFSQFSENTCVIGSISNNKFLVEDDGYIALYDPSISNNNEILEIRCPEDYGVDNIVEYVDSLVWIAPAKHEMVDDGGQN